MAAATTQRAKPRYTQEKAIHLFQIFTVILSIFGLIAWLHITVLTFLNQERKEMVSSNDFDFFSLFEAVWFLYCSIF